MSGPRTGAQGSLKINSERIKIKGGQASGQLLIMRRWFGKGKVLEGRPSPSHRLCAAPGMQEGFAPLGPGTALCSERRGPPLGVSLHGEGSVDPGPGQRGQGPVHPPPPGGGVPASSTQRWEQCTAALTLSTKAITSVWYLTAALELSLFLTGQSRGEGWPARRGGMGALHRAVHAPYVIRGGHPGAGYPSESPSP